MYLLLKIACARKSVRSEKRALGKACARKSVRSEKRVLKKACARKKQNMRLFKTNFHTQCELLKAIKLSHSIKLTVEYSSQ